MSVILVLEQDAGYAGRISSVLRAAGHEVHVVQGPEHALQIAAARPPQLFLASGSNAGAADLLDRFARRRGGPGSVVLLPSTLAEQVQAADYRADEILTKPFTESDLQALARRFLTAPAPAPPAAQKSQLTSADIFGDVLAEVEAEAQKSAASRRAASRDDVNKKLEETLAGVFPMADRPRPAAPAAVPPCPSPSARAAGTAAPPRPAMAPVGPAGPDRPPPAASRPPVPPSARRRPRLRTRHRPDRRPRPIRWERRPKRPAAPGRCRRRPTRSTTCSTRPCPRSSCRASAGQPRRPVRRPRPRRRPRCRLRGAARGQRRAGLRPAAPAAPAPPPYAPPAAPSFGAVARAAVVPRRRPRRRRPSRHARGAFVRGAGRRAAAPFRHSGAGPDLGLAAGPRSPRRLGRANGLAHGRAASASRDGAAAAARLDPGAVPADAGRANGRANGSGAVAPMTPPSPSSPGVRPAAHPGDPGAGALRALRRIAGLHRSRHRQAGRRPVEQRPVAGQRQLRRRPLPAAPAEQPCNRAGRQLLPRRAASPRRAAVRQLRRPTASPAVEKPPAPPAWGRRHRQLPAPRAAEGAAALGAGHGRRHRLVGQLLRRRAHPAALLAARSRQPAGAPADFLSAFAPPSETGSFVKLLPRRDDSQKVSTSDFGLPQEADPGLRAALDGVLQIRDHHGPRADGELEGTPSATTG